jgi:PEP-CTERM motif/Lectin C-type domain
MKSNISRLIKWTVGAYLVSAIFHCNSANAQWVTWTNGHNYMAVPGFAGLTWDMANTLAQQQGGYLASITSQAENDFVFSLINGSQFCNGYNGAGPCIGGYQTDELLEPAGHWAWTSGEAWSYTNWRPGLPNNVGTGPDGLCYYSGAPSTPANTWDDVIRNDAAPLGIGLGGYVVEMVPEPGSMAILGFGFLFVFRRRAGSRAA